MKFFIIKGCIKMRKRAKFLGEKLKLKEERKIIVNLRTLYLKCLNF